MKRIFYSPKYRKKLIKLKKRVEIQFGQEISKKVLRSITDRIHQLGQFEELGVSVRELYGVDTDYRYVYVAHNYVFYRLVEDYIRIIDIYNEREDFMLSLLGISSIDEEAENYWDDIERDNTP